VKGEAMRQLRCWLPGLVLLFAVVGLFHQTALDMVAVWMRHETYQHAFLVVPISAWLVWRQRAALSNTPVQSQPWVLALVLAISFLWLLGELAWVGAASQFAFVGMLVLIVPALYGWPMTRALLFPLAFLFFAVPFGEFVVPTLMHWTADFTVAALRLVGVPVYQEGLYFVIPTGSWSVIEACSGVRYLIASFMVGTLFAYLNYQGTQRRLLFMAVSIIVPLIANWLRAFMIVMIGHYSNNTLAVGVDHLLYGWVFFGIVIGLMFMIGARWSDARPGTAAPVPASSALGLAAPRHLTFGVGITFLVLLLAAPAWKLKAQSQQGAPVPLGAAAVPPGWRAVDLALPWSPGFIGATAERSAALHVTGDAEETVWEWVGYYATQGRAQKLVSIANRVSDEADKSWRVSRESVVGLDSAGVPEVFETHLVGGAVQAGNRNSLVIWRLYWIDGHWVIDDRWAKVRQAWSALRLRGEDGAAVLFATRNDEGASARLEQYLQARAAGLSAEMGAVRAGRH